MGHPKDFTVGPSASIFPETLGTAPSANRLKGRKILVVGGGQRKTVDTEPPIGNGRAISILSAREGAQVVVLDFNKEAAEATVAQITSEVGEGRATPYLFDVRNGDGIAKAVDDAKSAMGGFDGLVIVVGTSRRVPLEQLTRKSWEDDFTINTTSHFLFSQRAIEVMNPGGSIVLISSMSAIRALDNNPVYEASKAALLGLNMALARAGEAKGIRCNAICMGYVDTPMSRDSGRKVKSRARTVPFGRQATGWETAYTALYLTSHESAYVSGIYLMMDAGTRAGVAGRAREGRVLSKI